MAPWHMGEEAWGEMIKDADLLSCNPSSRPVMGPPPFVQSWGLTLVSVVLSWLCGRLKLSHFHREILPPHPHFKYWWWVDLDIMKISSWLTFSALTSVMEIENCASVAHMMRYSLPNAQCSLGMPLSHSLLGMFFSKKKKLVITHNLVHTVIIFSPSIVSGIQNVHVCYDVIHESMKWWSWWKLLRWLSWFVWSEKRQRLCLLLHGNAL